MSFREVIASFLSGGMGNHYSRYGDYTIGADKLSNNVVTFLRQWMESDDPVLRAHTGDEGTIVACAIEEFHIAEAGKDTIKRHNKGERDKIDELHRLADEAEKISKKLKEVEASGEIILTLGRNYSVWPRPPKLSFDEMASVHRNSAVILRAAARNAFTLPTKQTGAKVWARGQFLRGMVAAVLFSKSDPAHPDDRPEPRLVDEDCELIAALANLIFDTAYIAKDVRQALNTDRSSRSSKALKRKSNTFRKKIDIV
jgi:hypothetical protein